MAIDRKLNILDYENNDLKSKIVQLLLLFFAFWLLVKNKKFSPLFLFEQNTPKKVFCSLVDKKLAIMDYKNVDLKKSKLFHFSKGVSPWFLVKFWKFCSFFFLKKKKKKGQKKLFCKLVDRKLPILDYINKELRKFKVLYFF